MEKKNYYIIIEIMVQAVGSIPTGEGEVQRGESPLNTQCLTNSAKSGEQKCRNWKGVF